MAVYMGTTKVAPSKTVGQISSVLLRAKARQIITDYSGEGELKAIAFTLDLPGIPNPVAFRLPCRTEKLATLLRDKKQAERTGWRQVLRWVEAQIAMIDAGMTQAHEVFMPYALIPHTDNTMFQMWESQQKMLAAPEAQ